LIVSNDHRGELNTLLLHAADGRLRLRHLLPTLAPHYDLMLIDTQGARSVLLEMAVLASDLTLSPITPEILAARELRRGTLQLLDDITPYRHLGIKPPPLHLLINRVHPVSANARMIQQALRELFQGQDSIRVLDTTVPAIEAYPRAATLGLPVHRVESRKPAGRVAPAAIDSLRALAVELNCCRSGGRNYRRRPYDHRLRTGARQSTFANPDRVCHQRRLAGTACRRRTHHLLQIRRSYVLSRRDNQYPTCHRGKPSWLKSIPKP